MRNDRSFHLMFLAAAVLLTGGARAQERSHYQYWLELAAADQTYADRALKITGISGIPGRGVRGLS